MELLHSSSQYCCTWTYRHFNTDAIQQVFGISGENFHGAKHRQDHFTGLVWVNTDCCKQMPLAVASKAEKPQWFKHTKSLTCKWTSNKSASMACAVFEDNLRTVCVEMGGGDTGVQWPLSCSYRTVDQFQKYPLDYLPPTPTKEQSYDPWINFTKQWFRKKLICSLL